MCVYVCGVCVFVYVGVVCVERFVVCVWCVSVFVVWFVVRVCVCVCMCGMCDVCGMTYGVLCGVCVVWFVVCVCVCGVCG